MNDALTLIRTRRSTRVFRPEPVPADKLDMILDAGRHAPSGGNSQTTHFIVIRSGEVLDTLCGMVREAFAAMEITEGMYRSLAGSIRASKTGHYRFHYDAPALILTANRIDYDNNIADCACALENMMIMANALDLGSCWINQLKWLNESPAITEYLRTLGLAGNERVYGALSVGIPATADALPPREPLPRTGNPVTWVD